MGICKNILEGFYYNFFELLRQLSENQGNYYFYDFIDISDIVRNVLALLF